MENKDNNGLQAASAIISLILLGMGIYYFFFK